MTQGAEYWENRPTEDEKMDWKYDSKNWVEGYVDSKDHPHRKVIVDAIGHFLEPFETLLEVGCNAGPNISLIRDKFNYLKDHNLYGIDLNKESIDRAKEWLPAVHWEVGSVLDLPYEDKIMDVVLLDACLMYLDDKNITKAIEEIDRVCKKGIVICDWYNKSESGKVIDFHWSRDYSEILRKRGFKVGLIKLNETTWPGKTWAKNGYVFIAVRQLPTSKKK
jgi:ubiquinone/menaquinone biosynthesis C-methylase UbiE